MIYETTAVGPLSKNHFDSWFDKTNDQKESMPLQKAETVLFVIQSPYQVIDLINTLCF